MVPVAGIVEGVLAAAAAAAAEALCLLWYEEVAVPEDECSGGGVGMRVDVDAGVLCTD